MVNIENKNYTLKHVLILFFFPLSFQQVLSKKMLSSVLDFPKIKNECGAFIWIHTLPMLPKLLSMVEFVLLPCLVYGIMGYVYLCLLTNISSWCNMQYSLLITLLEHICPSLYLPASTLLKLEDLVSTGICFIHDK